jgi:uncharacterized protein (DUF362 family)
MDRRRFLQVSAGGVGAAAAVIGAKRVFAERHRVHIARASSYDIDLAALLHDGLRELGQLELLRGKKVLLKPNLVETAAHHAHINTHPAMVVAAAQVAAELGATEVTVAEGPGHRRDVELVLDESGLGTALNEHRLRFVDLNHDAVETVENRGAFTTLKQLTLPRTVLKADVVISMPKLKTHHWVGATLAMKNCFGIMPGLVYGWPKNRLHHEGINRSILDIVATVRPELAIVDGILGMEGDGPIMGTPKPAGVVVMGTNLPAVDATCTRIMQIDPAKVIYLAGCPSSIGHTDPSRIDLTGEAVRQCAMPFVMPPGKDDLRATV